MTQPFSTPFRAAVPLALVLVAAGCGGGRTDLPVPVAAAGCDDHGPARRADTIVVALPWEGSGDATAGCPGMALEFRVAAADERDQIDAGVDVVVTRDPATIAYARGRADFESVPLDWDRTYALVAPGRPVTWLADTSAGFRGSLARDAVAAAARGAEGPFWWEQDPVACPPDAEPPPPSQSGPVITYHERDRTARELAERLVALAATGGSRLRTAPRPSTAGIHSPPGDAATVMPVPREGSNADACTLRLRDATVVPLIDTRVTAIVRRAGARIVPEPNGRFRIFPAPARTE